MLSGRRPRKGKELMRIAFASSPSRLRSIRGELGVVSTPPRSRSQSLPVPRARGYDKKQGREDDSANLASGGGLLWGGNATRRPLGRHDPPPGPQPLPFPPPNWGGRRTGQVPLVAAVGAVCGLSIVVLLLGVALMRSTRGGKGRNVEAPQPFPLPPQPKFPFPLPLGVIWKVSARNRTWAGQQAQFSDH